MHKGVIAYYARDMAEDAEFALAADEARDFQRPRALEFRDRHCDCALGWFMHEHDVAIDAP